MSDRRLRIDFWDVGQGDASVIDLGNGELIVIDTGPSRSPLMDWLRQTPLKIHSLILTHNDMDHAGLFESILEELHPKIGHVYMLDDRPVAKEKAYFSLARARQRLGQIKLTRLEVEDGKRKKIWASPSVSTRFVAFHPEFATAGDAIRKQGKSNEVSGILGLFVNQKPIVLWCGDAHMSTVHKLCSQLDPVCVVGPHHGSPEDRDEDGYFDRFDGPNPETVFISVGGHKDHPRDKKFIRPHVQRGRRICCSQMKKRWCGKRRTKPLMSHHVQIGMIPPIQSEKTLTCRGAMQLYVNVDGTTEWDPFHGLHRDRVAKLGRKAMCLAEERRMAT